MSSRYQIAVVEDDPGLLADLLDYLRLRDFSAYGFASAESFLATWPATLYDVLLLDVALPGLSGLDIAQRVRAHGAGQRTGVVMLTALDANVDQVLGLDAGADMYLSKRSTLEVIEAACRSVLRRLHATAADAPGAATAWHLHTRRWQLLAPNAIPVELTHAEVLLLAALCRQPGLAITREALLQQLGKAETLSTLRNLDNTASRLRRKVQAACGIALPLRTSYGKGYTFNERCVTGA